MNVGLLRHILLRAAIYLLPVVVFSVGSFTAFARENFDCSEALSYVLGFDVTKSSRISIDNPITLEISERVIFLKFRLREKFLFLPKPKSEACQQQGDFVYWDLIKFIKARLQLLDEQNAPEKLLTEYQTIYLPTLSEVERDTLQNDFVEFEKKFLTDTYTDLCFQLQTTKWASFCENENIQLESWNNAWANLLGVDAPAAVRIYDQRIALRISNMSLAELELFIFHELAHLNDPATFYDEIRNEEFAWNETFDYIKYLSENGDRIPKLFVRIQKNSNLLGFKRWIKLLVGARKKM